MSYINYHLYPCGLSNRVMSLETGIVFSYLLNRPLLLGNNTPLAGGNSTKHKTHYQFPVHQSVPRITDLFSIPVPLVSPQEMPPAIEANSAPLICHDNREHAFMGAIVIASNRITEELKDSRIFRQFAHDRKAFYRLDDVDQDKEVLLTTPLGYLGNYESLFFIDDKHTRGEVFHLLSQLKPKHEYLSLSNQIAQELGSFNCLHVRLSDRSEYVCDANNIVENLSKVISTNDTLLILTDESENTEFFRPILKAFPNFLFLDEFIVNGFQSKFAQLPYSDNIVIALLSQYVARHAIEFFGSPTSTFSGFIHRLRYFDNPKVSIRYSFCLNDWKIDSNACHPALEPNGLFSWNRINLSATMDTLIWSHRFPECVNFFNPQSDFNLSVENEELRFKDQVLFKCFPVSDAKFNLIQKGEDFILNGPKHTTLQCNGVGAIVWKLFDGNKTVEQGVGELKKAFNDDSETIDQQVLGVLKEFENYGALIFSTRNNQSQLDHRLAALESTLSNDFSVPDNETDLCIVSVSGEVKNNQAASVPAGSQSLALLKESLERIGYFHAKLYAGIPADAPEYDPDTFKVRAIRRAMDAGYRYVLLVASNTVFTSLYSIDRILEHIRENGGLYVSNDSNVGDWTHDEFVNYFGVSRQFLRSIPECKDGFIGLDLSTDSARRFLGLAEAAIDVRNAFLYHGDSNNDRQQCSVDPTVRGHNRAQSVFSVIRYYLGLGITSDLAFLRPYDSKDDALTYCSANEKTLPEFMEAMKPKFMLMYSDDESTKLKPSRVRPETFSDKWKHWIWSNVDRGCNRAELFQILLNHGFSHTSITAELNFDPEIDQTDHSRTTIMPGRYRSIGFLPNAKQIESDRLELYVVPNFLSQDECNRLFDIIVADLNPSETVGEVVDDPYYRTNSTCQLGKAKELIVGEVDIRICKYLGISPAYSESAQGQYYLPGEEYKAHCDWFGEDAEILSYAGFNNNQRTWTALIYLNDVELGGETEFPNLDFVIKPKRGNLIVWNNLLTNGRGNPDAIHRALPILRGHKAILTKWFRSFGNGPESIREPEQDRLNYHAKGLEKTKNTPAAFRETAKSIDARHSLFPGRDGFRGVSSQ